MRDILINSLTLWLLAALCFGVALGINVGVGDGFGGVAIGLAVASAACLVRDVA